MTLVGESEEALYSKDINWCNHILELCPNHHNVKQLRQELEEKYMPLVECQINKLWEKHTKENNKGILTFQNS